MRLESVTYYPSIEPDVCERVLTTFLEHPDLGFCAVAETDELLGFIAATNGRYVFSSVKYAIMNIFYVVPEKRHTRAPVLLFQAFEKWGRENADMLISHYHIGSDLEKFLKRFGYEQYGVQFVKCATRLRQ